MKILENGGISATLSASHLLRMLRLYLYHQHCFPALTGHDDRLYLTSTELQASWKVQDNDRENVLIREQQIHFREP